MNQLPYVIQCQCGSGWRDVGSRRDAEDAERVAKAWADDAGLEHRILSPNGSVHLGPIPFTPASDADFKAVRYGVRRARGESKVQARLGADADVASRRAALFAAAGGMQVVS
jgi:hypothetical protein